MGGKNVNQIYNNAERPLHILPIENHAKCYANAIIYIIEDGFSTISYFQC